MEYLEVLDSKGNPTGEKKLRKDIYKDGDIHNSVHVWIVNFADEVLVQKRTDAMFSYPGMWDISVGGHPAAGESSVAGAVRETKEELGLELKESDLKHLFRVYEEDKRINKKEFADVYLVEMNVDPTGLVLQKEEVLEVKLVHFKKMKEMIKDQRGNFVPHNEEYEKMFKYLEKRE